MKTATDSYPCPMCDATDVRLLYTKSVNGKQYHLARCSGCGQHYCVPPPTVEERKALYSGDYHSQLRAEGVTEKVFAPKFRGCIKWIQKFLRGGRTLDIGTATGLFPGMLKRAGFDAEGLEYNATSAQWGEKHYGVKIRACGLDDSDVPKNSYDLISMTDVLEHTEHPLRFLLLAREYLKPGGYMLVTFPDIESAESRVVRVLTSAMGRPHLWRRCCNIPDHVWEFTPATARAMFRRAGFDVVDFRRRPEAIEKRSLKTMVLLTPLYFFHLPVIGRILGTQMQFVIRKNSLAS